MRASINWEPLKKTVYEIVDVDEAYAFFTTDAGQRDDYKAAIELVGHRCIIKESKS